MFKKILSFEILPVLALLITCLLIGVFTVKDYGQSWDEILIYDYANYSIKAYQHILHPSELEPFRGHLNYYGPAYFMIATVASRLIKSVDPTLSHINSIHLAYFITTQISILILYLLSRRWMSRWAAFITTLLFASQPLIWGHSFMNPKDPSFMVFFLASVYFGFQMMDATPNSKWKWVIPAGVILGLTISLRVIGPWAGVLVFLYGLFKFPKKITSTFPYYVLIAIATTYLAWPYLWGSPINSFMESLKIMSNFPFVGQVLFSGGLYTASETPGDYFLVLLSLQLTEPALIFIVLGLIVSLVNFIKGKDKEPLLLFTVWFLLLVFWIIVSHSALYDNARQLLFLWPVLFILAGFGINWLISFMKSTTLKVVLAIVVVMPGILACIHLHPYQYIYYNSLIGGVKGAYRNFELDYWVTSFKESMEYLNENAEEGSTIVVFDNRPVARQYARPDLVLIVPKDMNEYEGQTYYVLSSTRADQGQFHCKDLKIVFAAEREGGILSYIKKVSADQTCK